jgi:hypothetical protein
MKIKMPKTKKELKDWVFLGKNRKSTWRRFCTLMAITQFQALETWERERKLGNIILEVHSQTAWVRKSIVLQAIQTSIVTDRIDLLYDDLSLVERQDMETLISKGYTVEEAREELHLHELATAPDGFFESGTQLNMRTSAISKLNHPPLNFVYQSSNKHGRKHDY